MRHDGDKEQGAGTGNGTHPTCTPWGNAQAALHFAFHFTSAMARQALVRATLRQWRAVSQRRKLIEALQLLRVQPNDLSLTRPAAASCPVNCE